MKHSFFALKPYAAAVAVLYVVLFPMSSVALKYSSITYVPDDGTNGASVYPDATTNSVKTALSKVGLALMSEVATAAQGAKADTAVQTEIDPIAYPIATNAQATADTSYIVSTNALDILYGFATNGSVLASTILGNPTNCWLDIVEELPYIHRKAATADIRVEAVFDDMNNNQPYSGPPVGTVWQNIGVGAWASTNGWALTNTINNVWLIQNGYMSPVIFGNQNVSEFPASLSGTYPFSMGSLVLDWVYNTDQSKLLEEPDISNLATTNWVKSIIGVYPDIATNLTYHIVVSNGNWLIIEN